MAAFRRAGIRAPEPPGQVHGYVLVGPIFFVNDTAYVPEPDITECLLVVVGGAELVTGT